MFLNAVRPHLRDKCEVQLRVKRDGDVLAITVIPKIDGIDPDTDDATLAALQAALSKPFHLTVSATEDPDQVLANVLTNIGQAHATVHDDLDKYKAQIEADRVAAKEAAEKKKADDKAKSAKKTQPVTKPAAKKDPVTKSAPSAAAAPSPKPEPVAAADLFSAPTAEAETTPATSSVSVQEPDTEKAKPAVSAAPVAEDDDGGWGDPAATDKSVNLDGAVDHE